MRLWLTQPPLTQARLNRMSSAPPVPPFQLPRLTECLYSAHSCHKSRHAWHACYSGRSGQQISQSVGSQGARLSSGVLPWHLQCGSRPESGLMWSPTSACWPRWCVSNVPTSVQKHESDSNMDGKSKRWTGPVPSFQMLCHSMLGSVSPRSAPLPPLCLPLMRRDAHWARAN